MQQVYDRAAMLGCIKNLLKTLYSQYFRDKFPFNKTIGIPICYLIANSFNEKKK